MELAEPSTFLLWKQQGGVAQWFVMPRGSHRSLGTENYNETKNYKNAIMRATSETSAEAIPLRTIFLNLCKNMFLFSIMGLNMFVVCKPDC